MSSCVELFHLVSPLVDFPHVFLTEDLGEAPRVREAIERAFPDVHWLGERGLVVDDPTGTTAEIILWRDGVGAVDTGVVDRIAVAIHDGGDPMSIVAPLCLIHGWTACDSTLQLIDSESGVRRIWSSERLRNTI
ncbi:hypothetical protein [Pendulispora albinea]|uniref:Uncharacterized protein n=1 Tax=Pendulispora albinea TaxID=2741071 RepID=A0ABZ2LY37_9BACT